MSDEHKNSWGCLLPFDTDDREFIRGVEIGRLWERLKWDDGEIVELLHANNAEMVLRISEATERGVRSEELGGDWIEVTVDAA